MSSERWFFFVLIWRQPNSRPLFWLIIVQHAGCDRPSEYRMSNLHNLKTSLTFQWKQKMFKKTELSIQIQWNTHISRSPHHHHLSTTSYDKNLRPQVWQACFQLSNKPSTSQNPSELSVQQLVDCFYKSPRTARPARPAKSARKTQQKIKTT